MSEIVLQSHQLSKRYGRVHSVQDVSLQVQRGDIYAFLGPNGAGKTTTLRLMLGLARPSGGWVEMLGERIRGGRRAMLRRVGALVERPSYYPNLTVRQNLDYHRQVLDLPRWGTVAEALDHVALTPQAETVAGALSLGDQQRLGLAIAFLGAPELLILDEPINGLDPAGIRQIRGLFAQWAAEQGTTFFITSHRLTEVQHFATEIGFLHRGRLIEQISAAQLAQRSQSYLQIQVDDARRAAWVLEHQLGLREFVVFPREELRLFIALERAAEINRALIQHEVAVKALVPQRETLEDYFLKVTADTPT